MSQIQLSLYTVITSIIVSGDVFTRRDSIIFFVSPKIYVKISVEWMSRMFDVQDIGISWSLATVSKSYWEYPNEIILRVQHGTINKFVCTGALFSL